MLDGIVDEGMTGWLDEWNQEGRSPYRPRLFTDHAWHSIVRIPHFRSFPNKEYGFHIPELIADSEKNGAEIIGSSAPLSERFKSAPCNGVIGYIVFVPTRSFAGPMCFEGDRPYFLIDVPVIEEKLSRSVGTLRYARFVSFGNDNGQ